MEQDINLIVDVDPDEASCLIELIELLFEEWYVSRERRQERLQRLERIADEKRDARHRVAESDSAMKLEVGTDDAA